MEVCLWTRTDQAGIASIMLSTLNLKLMEEIRHEIRKGYRLETFNKSQFVRRYGISMYVPKEHANLTPLRLLRSLFYKNPNILLCYQANNQDGRTKGMKRCYAFEFQMNTEAFIECCL